MRNLSPLYFALFQWGMHRHKLAPCLSLTSCLCIGRLNCFQGWLKTRLTDWTHIRTISLAICAKWVSVPIFEYFYRFCLLLVAHMSVCVETCVLETFVWLAGWGCHPDCPVPVLFSHSNVPPSNTVYIIGVKRLKPCGARAVSNSRGWLRLKPKTLLFLIGKIF